MVLKLSFRRGCSHDALVGVGVANEIFGEEWSVDGKFCLGRKF